jgi:hypothetical protein
MMQKQQAKISPRGEIELRSEFSDPQFFARWPLQFFYSALRKLLWSV